MRRNKFKPGQTIVFEPSWAPKKQEGATVHPKHPLKYGDLALFLADITPAIGHCVVTTYEGRVVTMVHPEDFRAATEDEV